MTNPVFSNSALRNTLEQSTKIESQAFITAEINMNSAENIGVIGNYRYRHSGTEYTELPAAFVADDPAYVGATDADVVIDGGMDSNDNPISIISIKEKQKLLYSLEDCFYKFRPRSGINKAVSFGERKGHYSHHINQQMMDRPRYYISDKNDKFKYWTSFRTENGIERGISKSSSTTSIAAPYIIDDANPFVVYKEAVPANRIVVKVQTHVGSSNLYPGDPFFENESAEPINRATPNVWKIEYLDSDDLWVTAKEFNSGSPSSAFNVPIDGYIELRYLPGFGTWTVSDVDDQISDAYVSDFSTSSYEYKWIRGIRVSVETMTKHDVPLDLIEMSPRLVLNLTDITEDFRVSKVASDLGVSGMPVGQLLASTGQISFTDFDEMFNPNNPDSAIGKYLSKNIQFKFYDVITSGSTQYMVPIKTLYSEEFPKITATDRQISMNLRDLFFHFESLTAPSIVIPNAPLSYALCMLFDSIGFSNYKFYRVLGEADPIIPFFYIRPDTSVAQVLNEIAVSTQTAMFFDEENNFVMMSKNYIMPTAEQRPTSFTFRGYPDGEGALPNIEELSLQDNRVFNDGRISYSSRYIQRTYGSIKQASLIDKEKTWLYKPVLLWEIAASEITKSINEETGTQSAYTLSAIPLNSELSNVEPSVVDGNIINNVLDFGDGIYWVARYNGYFYANGEVIKYDAVEYSIPGVANTVWITSTLEYQNYFSKIPFNGQMYPTGRIRIYTEPFYDSFGLPADGPVAKHGRAQFGTSIVTHPAGISDYWTGPDSISGFKMSSKYLFKQSPAIIVDGVKKGATTKDLIVSTSTGIEVGYYATVMSGPGSIPVNAKVTAIQTVSNTLSITLNLDHTIDTAPTSPVKVKFYIKTVDDEAAGVITKESDQFFRHSTRRDKIKNFLSASYFSENADRSRLSSQSGTLSSSALIFTGPTVNSVFDVALDNISYVHKPFTDNTYSHFGTRMRIVGRVEDKEKSTQNPTGSSDYNSNMTGSSGGLGVLVDPGTNLGYYFEIIALTDYSDASSVNGDEVANVVFYKVVADETGNAVPLKMWSALSTIICDDGQFVGQYRMAAENNPTVYDLAVEVESSSPNSTEDKQYKKFFLYINNELVGTVIDNDPLPDTRNFNNMALFVRGSSECMFENVYALSPNRTQNSVTPEETPLRGALLLNKESDSDRGLARYSLPEAIQQTYISQISAIQPPSYNLYFEEFGTTMRECAYFDVRYDKAYPAFYSKIAPTFNKLKGYAVSGYVGSAYGAEFLIFNTTDTALNLDETSGNYLRILGVTFTQQSDHQLTVDEFFSKRSDFSSPEFSQEIDNFNDIKINRITYGRNEFSLNAPYIQSQDSANNMMEWFSSKIMKPRKAVGLTVFSIPTVRLGDIVEVVHKSSSGIDEFGLSESRYVVYNIEYSRNIDGPEMTVYLSEVL